MHDMITTNDPDIKGTYHKVTQFNFKESLAIGNALQCYKDYLERMIDEIPTEEGKNIERQNLLVVNKLLVNFIEF